MNLILPDLPVRFINICMNKSAKFFFGCRGGFGPKTANLHQKHKFS